MKLKEKKISKSCNVVGRILSNKISEMSVLFHKVLLFYV